MSKPVVTCPECRFGNRPGDRSCLFCRSPLGSGEEPTSPNTAPDEDSGEQRFGRTRVMKRPFDPDKLRGIPLIPADSDILPIDESGEIRAPAWLCGDGLPPIALGLGPRLSIGRHPNCDLVLPHKEVSRKHAEIVKGPDGLVFEDAGSSNGTFLNGVRVSTAPLEAGDILVLGPYQLTVRSQEQLAGSDQPHDSSTRIFRFLMNASITGRIEEMPIAELLQGMEFNRKTGTLTVESGKHSGRLVVREGAPVFAWFANHQNEEAVLTMLRVKRGTFSFTAVAEVEQATMSCSLGMLLMEASRRQDEASTGGSSNFDQISGWGSLD